MKYCVVCGSESPDRAKKCRHCKSPLEDDYLGGYGSSGSETDAYSSYTNTSDNYGLEQPKKKRTSLFMLLGSSLTLAVAGIICITTRNSPSGSAASTPINTIVSQTSIPTQMASPTTGREYLPEAGYYAPDFTLTTIDDEAITLSDLQGHPVMILFWATWCGYCRDEMPTIQQISDDYADEGLIVIGINGSDSANDVRNYRSSLNLTFPLLMDSNQIVSALYRVDGYPSLYYIDRAGLIQVVQGGSGGPSMLYANLDQILP